VTVRLGPYRVIRRLAIGGMAEILLARFEGRPLALKRILPHLAGSDEMVALFEEEARIAARLTHPNVVRVHDFARIDGAWVLALEYVAGIDLRQLMARARAALPAELVAGIGAELCAALEHAHQLGVVHGDVSPSNILRGFDGSVKLCDFGVSNCPGRGKRGYAAPEQAAGGFDGRADLHAVGVVANELLRGRRFGADGAASGLVPSTMAGIIASACSPARDDRPASAAGMAAGFDSILPSLEVAAAERRALLSALFSPDEIAAGHNLGVVEEDGEATQPLQGRQPNRRRRGPGRGIWLGLGLAAVSAAALVGSRARRA
jgi:serine/threonine protein kinase